MKRTILALVALLMMTVSANAMSYEQARRQALFLTDKMAYELNLTDEQYEEAYEINLDYLMGVSTYDDLYGAYWTQRNLDLSYILFDWQYRMYLDASYFYRPLYWDGGYWHFAVYARYPHRDYFFFGCPDFYAVYRGGHSWRMNGGRSWYDHHRPEPPRDRGNFRGMRDGFDRGDYGNGTRAHNGSFGNGPRNGNINGQQGGVRSDGTRSFGSDTRSEMGNNRMTAQGARPNASFGGGRSQNGVNNGTISRGNNNSSAVRRDVNNDALQQTNRPFSFGERSNTTLQRSTSGATQRESTTTFQRNNNNELQRSNTGTLQRSNTGTVQRPATTIQRTPTPSAGNRIGVNRQGMSSSSRTTVTRPSSESRTFSAPTRSFSAPSRSFSAPTRSFTPSRSSSVSAPSRSTSSMSRSFSAPSGGSSSMSRSTGSNGGGRSFGGRR